MVKKTLIIYFINLLMLLVHPYVSKAQELNYFSPTKIKNYADYLFNEGDYLRAASEYQRYSFTISDSKETALYLVGLSYRKGREYQKAIKNFSDILNDYPDSKLLPSVYYQLSLAYIENMQFMESLSLLHNTIERDNNNKTEMNKLIFLKGVTYLNLKKWDMAIMEFDSINLNNEKESFNDYVKQYRSYSIKGKNLNYKSPTLSGIMSAVIP
ncbi:MAG: tetratricopeptide repeat protein [Nitrospirae bacterium]|nr:tetratricopeptide repeat protein [Nitrospirota bacterium]